MTQAGAMSHLIFKWTATGAVCFFIVYWWCLHSPPNNCKAAKSHMGMPASNVQRCGYYKCICLIISV